MSAPTSVPTTEYKPIMGGNWQAEGACQECSTGSTGGICTHEILTGYCCRTTSRPWAFRATEWKAHCVNKPQQQTLAKQVSRRFKRAWERKRERERTWEKKKRLHRLAQSDQSDHRLRDTEGNFLNLFLPLRKTKSPSFLAPNPRQIPTTPLGLRSWEIFAKFYKCVIE